jgi:hypothetical protein
MSLPRAAGLRSVSARGIFRLAVAAFGLLTVFGGRSPFKIIISTAVGI